MADPKRETPVEGALDALASEMMAPDVELTEDVCRHYLDRATAPLAAELARVTRELNLAQLDIAGMKANPPIEGIWVKEAHRERDETKAARADLHVAVTAFRLGYDGAKGGTEEDENPYADGSGLHAHWHRGWGEGHALVAATARVSQLEGELAAVRARVAELEGREAASPASRSEPT